VDAATCPSVAQRCADTTTSDPGCGTTWSTAQQPSTWCPEASYWEVAPQCEGFDIVRLGGVDSSTYYYYDLQTGDLVGIERHGLGPGPSCVAGHAPGVELIDCIDAGGVTTFYCGTDGSFSDSP
jgi:hypothetical protein